MPNVMAALPKIGGALCSTPQSLADAQYTWLPSSNAAKTRNPLKFAGVPQTTGSISAASGPKFTILLEHMEKVLLLNTFFPIVDTCLSCEDIAREICTMLRRWRLIGDFFASCIVSDIAIFVLKRDVKLQLTNLRPAFSASRVQHVSDLHPKFALRPHHVWKYGRHPICDGWD